MIKIRKKNNALEEFDFNKIIVAVQKSADRVGINLDVNFTNNLRNNVHNVITNLKCQDVISVYDMHEIVQEALKDINNDVYKEYMSYRDYKKRFTKIFDNLLHESNRIVYSGDKENANKNSMLVSTKKGILVNELSKEIMLEYELPKEAAQAHKNGDMYIHDLGDRLFNSINCCLFDMGDLLKDGFTLNGVQYTETTSAESFMRVMSDIVLEASSQQYGGFTVPEIDTVGEKYVKKALEESYKYYKEQLEEYVPKEKLINLSEKYVERALDQGFQAVETRLNTISNSNTQTPFVTFSFGLNTTKEGRMISKAILKNRMKGLGKQKLTPVFPKLVFLHRDGINGQEGDKNYDLYDMAIECMMIRMYPDQLSLDNGYLGEIFDKYGLAISPMGCRAYLSPYYPPNSDKPIFTGRANCGAITLNTVRYAIEAKKDEKKYFKLFDENFEKALKVHLYTFDRMKDVKASTNPLFFCEGGCHVKLKPDETIEKAIRTFTWSFGYIGLTEASYLMTGKHIHEDNSFAIKVLTHLENLVDEAKNKYRLLFAIYGTPAESLCYKFRNLDYEKYGEIKYVTDKEYYMNSFHVDVKAHINPIQKQDIELPMFNISKGGRIHYSEFPNTKNKLAIKQVIDEGMKKGLYQGLNLELDCCDDCYHQGEFKEHKCPKCGSENTTEICRVCGYLGYKKTNKDTRLGSGKFAETEDRVDHFDFEVSDNE
ncbi:TPA: anaerobic ribonucleoside-triphosphate reductase [Clostridium botulinum]